MISFTHKEKRIEVKLMKDIGIYIKEILDEENKSQRWLAEQLEIKEATVSAWIKGVSTPRTKSIPKIADALGVKVDRLIWGENYPKFNEKSSSASLQILGYSSCGFGTENNGEVTDYFEIPSDLIKGSPNDYFCVYAEGNSMIDAHIPSGALMIFKKQIEALDGVILACMVNNEAYTKRYRQIGTLPMLFSENSREDYEPIVITKDTEFSVHGKLEKVIIDF